VSEKVETKMKLFAIGYKLQKSTLY